MLINENSRNNKLAVLRAKKVLEAQIRKSKAAQKCISNKSC
jgi:hypothetical protein